MFRGKFSKERQWQGDNKSPNQGEEYQRQRQARILAREATLQLQQEELDVLIRNLDRVYNDIEQKCIEDKRPRARKVYDVLVFGYIYI